MLFKQAQGALPDDIPSAKPQSHISHDIPSAKQTTNTGWTPQLSAKFDSNAVKDMQTAILNFARTLAAHPVMSMQQSGTQELLSAQNGKPLPPDYLGGTTPFGNFLVHQYVNNAKVVGEQFVNIGLSEPLRSGSAIPNVNLAGIINTIGVVGSTGAEHKPDGVWQTRTNNALKQIYAVGVSLMQFAKDMKFNINGVSDSDLETFKNEIPASYTDLKGTASKRAMLIAPIIDKLTKLYKAFETSILEHPEYKALIGQDKAFMDHAQMAPMELSKDEGAFYEAHKDAVIPNTNINGKPLRLMDIANITAFQHFLKGANVDISKLSEIQKYVNTVKSILGGAPEHSTDLGPGF